MRAISFIVPGEPVAKGRPRVSARNGVARMYTPKKTENYENLVAMAAQQAMGNGIPLEGPLLLEVTANVSIPKSKSKKVQEAMRKGSIRPTKRPDLDNYLKAVSDGCNSVVYADDSQIVAIKASKFYSDKPSLFVIISELDGMEGDL
jgi:Holliday junction resolvase RusA-like endonuclease